jgi:uncharacterized cupredoxin-like copper-binding protein
MEVQVNTIQSRGRGLATITLLAVMVVACAGPTASPTPAPAAGPITATLTEFHVKLSAARVKAGEVTFNITNSGSIDHEFVVLKTDTRASALPQADGTVPEGDMELMGEAEDITPGSSQDLTLTLPAGHYVILCNVEGHYSGGMWLDLTVV